MSQTYDPGDFDEFERALQTTGTDGALNCLEQKFRQGKQFPQLFEVLKMRCRAELGLPLIYEASTDHQVDDVRQRQLEEGLLKACLEVGLLLWEQGNLEQGWMYLQAVGNRAEIVSAIERFPIDDDNRDFLIELAISQGVAPVFGYQLLLQKYGTCNAITSFDMQATRFDSTTQLRMAQILLHHIYGELRGNILHSLREQQEKTNLVSTNNAMEPSCSLSELIEAYPIASARHGHHIDATHLASIVRIARLVRVPQDLKLALELTNYGLDLHSDFHYPSPPPFEDTYLDHRQFYQTQLGIEVEAGLSHFRYKCETVPTDRFGAVAFETLADLLIRIGRRDAAIKLLSEQVWGKLQPAGVLGNVFLIPQTDSERARLQTFFRNQQDLLSFALSRLNTC